MKEDNTEQIEIRKSIKYDKVRHLIYASYFLGQEAGLNRKLYNHPVVKDNIEYLISLILKEI